MVTPSRDQELFHEAARLDRRALGGAGTKCRWFARDADVSWAATTSTLQPSDRPRLLIRNAALARRAANPRVSSLPLFLAGEAPFGPDWSIRARRAS